MMYDIRLLVVLALFALHHCIIYICIALFALCILYIYIYIYLFQREHRQLQQQSESDTANFQNVGKIIQILMLSQPGYTALLKLQDNCRNPYTPDERAPQIRLIYPCKIQMQNHAHYQYLLTL